MTASERSKYYEFCPPGSLSDRIMCLWAQQIDDSGGDYLHPVLPDGCIDIVWIGSDPPVVAGPMTHRVIVALPAGTRLVGVRFNPGLAASFLGLPTHQLLNQHIPLTDIWGGGARLFEELVSRQQSVSANLHRISEAIAIRLASSHRADPLILVAVSWLAGNPTGCTWELVRLLGVSSRQLHRRFLTEVGYGPKVFQRVMRFQRVLAAASQHDALACLAGSVGYSDQAHMCREVRAFAGPVATKLSFNSLQFV